VGNFNGCMDFFGILYYHLLGTISALPACRDGSIDVTGKGLTAKKAPYIRAFRTSGNQCRGDDLTAKIALSE